MITVTITEDTLTKFQAKRGRPEACANGLALFRQIATMSKRSPSGKLRIKVKWTRLHQLWAATVYPEFYAWLREEGLAPQISMRSANLRIADLRSANLGGANLGGADLGGANLYSADLGGADLGGANLYGAYLYGADLGGADLRIANLRGADLRSANLGGANLGGANLGGADLRGADLGEWERGADGYARRIEKTGGGG